MANMRYGPGDIVILKEGSRRTSRLTSRFKILAVMPEIGGEVQYQVRSDVEGFERRIPASEIDIERSAASNHVPTAPTPRAMGEPWFKPSAVRTKK